MDTADAYYILSNAIQDARHNGRKYSQLDLETGDLLIVEVRDFVPTIYAAYGCGERVEITTSQALELLEAQP